MDGVPDLTQSPIEPGDSFDYAFVAPDAGTYWYHSHNRSWEQMARGLHGVLIVEEKEPPQVDQDLLLVLDDWRLREDGEIDAESFGHMMDLSHGGRLGNILAFNGSAKASEFSVRSGERVRLRICNVANARIFEVRLDGHQPWVVALDGQPTTPFEPDKRGITVAPAQRVDLIFDLVCGKRRPFRQGARMTEQRKRRIAVLGASGSVGRRIVVRLLERGFEVLCQTRTAEKLSHVADRVEVQAFEPRDAGQLCRFVAGTDAVIFALGTDTAGATTLFSETTALLIDAMRKNGVGRLIAITGVGAGERAAMVASSTTGSFSPCSPASVMPTRTSRRS